MPDVRVEVDPETADALQTESELLGFDDREAYLAWIVENRAAIEQGTESAELLSSYRERLVALEERLAADGVDPDEVDGTAILDAQDLDGAGNDGASDDAAAGGSDDAAAGGSDVAADGTDDSAADEAAGAPTAAPSGDEAEAAPAASDDESIAPSGADASAASESAAVAGGAETPARDEICGATDDGGATDDAAGGSTAAAPDGYDEPRVLDLDARGFYGDDRDAADVDVDDGDAGDVGADDWDAETVDVDDPAPEIVDADDRDAADLDADDLDVDDLDTGGSNADVTGYSDAAVDAESDADAGAGTADAADEQAASGVEQAASDGGSPTGSHQQSVTGADVTSMHLKPERVQRVSEDPVSEDAGELTDVETNRVDELSRRAVAQTREALDRDVETGLAYASSPAVPSSDVRPGEDLAELDEIDVPGRSEQVVAERREVVGRALAYLRDEGEARRSAFVDALYEDHAAGYETADSWWRCVREGLAQVEAVDGGHVWSYED